MKPDEAAVQRLRDAGCTVTGLDEWPTATKRRLLVVFDGSSSPEALAVLGGLRELLPDLEFIGVSGVAQIIDLGPAPEAS